jgi:pimeloyl-ACP methyl ester carboxylesterase
MGRSRKGISDIHYEVRGEGPDLVMLRGLGRNIKHWLGFDKIAAEHFRTITIDARGLGKSTRQMSPLDTIYDLADDVVRVLDDVGVEQSHVLGVSLGGMVTMAMGLRHPARTSSLVIINSSIAGSGHPRLSLPAWLLLARAVALGPAIYDDLARLLLGPEAAPELRKKVAREWLKIDQSMKVSPGLIVKQIVAASRFRVRDELGNISVPTLVLYGMGDQFVPNANSDLIARLIPRAKKVGIEGAGHELTIDRPEEAIEEIRKFIKWSEARK